MRTVRSRSGILAIVVTVALIAGLSLLVLPSASAAPNPPGNNGTIKVDREPFDDQPNNEPHVGCVFQVDFYGFDAGDLNADVVFDAYAPTLPDGSKVLLTDTVPIGEDDNSGGGSTRGLDASETYTLDLSGITPHPQQGVHVKLTIHADGSQGADTKYKVFWVTGCGGEESSTTTSTTMKGATSSSEESSSTTTTERHGHESSSSSMGEGGSSSESSAGAGVGGAASSSPTGGAGLPFTGSESLPMVLAGLALLGLGGAMIGRSRLRRDRA